MLEGFTKVGMEQGFSFNAEDFITSVSQFMVIAIADFEMPVRVHIVD